MSGTEPGDPPAELTLAAEYVLGTLEPVDQAAAAHRASTDAAFAGEIAFWEVRLAPLALLAPPVPPPAGLWTRIEDSTAGRTGPAAPAAAPPRPANDNRLTAWRIATFAGFALAAGLAAFILLRPPSQPPALAVLTPYGANTQVVLALQTAGGAIEIRPNAAVKVPDGKDLQLWQMPPGATRPASLGVIPVAGTIVPAGVARGTTLLVSLEPKGGSPTGQPTGPVLFGGTLSTVD
jgi:anti-sigma-K factor RskA